MLAALPEALICGIGAYAVGGGNHGPFCSNGGNKSQPDPNLLTLAGPQMTATALR